MIKFLDVGYTYEALKPDLDNAIGSVLGSGWFINGKALDSFERAFADYCGCAYAVGTGNGLDAISLILAALGIGAGDEVVVSGHTFIATWIAVARSGATIVPADADPDTMNVDLEEVRKRITPHTRAVVVVHLYGTPVDCSGLRSELEANGIALIEDAAQAHGARVRGRRAGALGAAAAFSFYPAKNLGAFGDGGAVTTDDPDIARRVRLLGNYGSAEKYHHSEIGVNSRLDELQAAVLQVKLGALDNWNARRAEIARQYVEGLGNLPDLVLPSVDPNSDQVWHLFVVRSRRRDDLADALAQEGVPTQIHYPIPNHRAGAFSGMFENVRLPVTEAICARCLSLPIGPHLSDGDVEQIIDTVRAATRRLDSRADLKPKSSTLAS